MLALAVLRGLSASEIRDRLSNVKVRVRIDTQQYLGYLSYHFVNDTWLMTAK